MSDTEDNNELLNCPPDSYSHSNGPFNSNQKTNLTLSKRKTCSVADISSQRQRISALNGKYDFRNY